MRDLPGIFLRQHARTPTRFANLFYARFGLSNRQTVRVTLTVDLDLDLIARAKKGTWHATTPETIQLALAEAVRRPAAERLAKWRPGLTSHLEDDP
jgi:hypothetical protein